MNALRAALRSGACAPIALGCLLALPVFVRATSRAIHGGPKSTPAASRARPRPDVARFRVRVEKALADRGTQGGFWGLLVEDRDTGEILYDQNADRFFTPASNAKLFTTAFALAELGGDYRYRTTLESDAALTSDGYLGGDLILVGRGDPDLSNRIFPYTGKEEYDGGSDKVLRELAGAVVARGLKEVDGDIVADDSHFPYDPYPEGWNVGDLFFDFGAPVSAIAFNDNTVGIVVLPGAQVGNPAIVSADPAAALADIDVSVITSAEIEKPNVGVGRGSGARFLNLNGSVPLGSAPLHLSLAMPDPAATAARTLEQLLIARGVRITGTIRVRHAPPPDACDSLDAHIVRPSCLAAQPAHSLVLAEHFSPPLLESVRLTNKISQNLHAELFLRTVAREKGGYGSTNAGIWLEQDFLKAAGIPEGSVLLSDGSGLSRDDLVTPRAVVQLLRYAWQQPWGEEYASTLPIAGLDGTLESRFHGTAAAGIIQAKTGSLEHVHSISGYATTLRGEHLVFSIFANNSPQKGRDATAALDAIGVDMIETLGVKPKKRK
ncbi:MAG: D-alanyl-D-alanine carboxypeptidase/D-alanyl-D-alanine endopeptidase [Candidatus Acidiferrales bacterium]